MGFTDKEMQTKCITHARIAKIMGRKSRTKKTKCTNLGLEKATQIGTTKAMPAKQRQNNYTHNDISTGAESPKNRRQNTKTTSLPKHIMEQKQCKTIQSDQRRKGSKKTGVQATKAMSQMSQSNAGNTVQHRVKCQTHNPSKSNGSKHGFTPLQSETHTSVGCFLRKLNHSHFGACFCILRTQRCLSDIWTRPSQCWCHSAL